MRKLLLLTVMLLVTVSSFAQDGRSIYNKYSDEDNVSAVYISQAMFRLIGKLPAIELEEGDMDLTGVINTLNGFYLISSENKKINSSLQSDVEKMVKAGKYEMMMEVKDNGTIVRIYLVGDEKIVSSLVVLVNEGEECTFLSIDGKMSRDKMNEVIADAME